MRLKDRLLILFAPPLASFIIRLLHLSIRPKIIGREHLEGCWGRGENPILSFWHDQLLLMVLGYPGKSIRILISASKDGELIARVMKSFGFEAIRGSSTRGGRKAFKELVATAKEPIDLAITPDGPQGPRHHLKDGVVALARVSKRPVLPLTFVCSRGHRFASWDRFLMPFPFARGIYLYGEPVYYDPERGTDHFRESLQLAMDANLKAATAYLENKGVSAI
jgi:lysophospholipid acyltransferase (LPLAT)-like uncharacterized protein